MTWENQQAKQNAEFSALRESGRVAALIADGVQMRLARIQSSKWADLSTEDQNFWADNAPEDAPGRP